MKTTIQIRRAIASDAYALTDIVFRSKQSNGYDNTFMEACRDELRITPDVLRKRNYWVAEDANLLGCAALGPGTDSETGEVHAFFIDPAFQRRGVGQALWAELRQQASAMGWRRLVLDADPEAAPFYTQLGFRVIGESPSGSIAGRMLPLMSIDLMAQSPPHTRT